MGWTGDPVWLADVLREAGLPVVEMPGWKNHGHGDFGWIWGSMYHHTGSNGTSAEFCSRGRVDLAGPICNVHVNREGVMTMVAVGIAWHGGSGSYPGIPRDTANWHTIGFEVQYDGKAITQKQRENMIIAMAAISKKLGRTANQSVVGHKEYSDMGKWDPGNVDMNDVRRKVQAQINHGPGKVKHEPIASHAKDAWSLSGDEYFGPLSGPENSISGLYGEPTYKMRSLVAFQQAVGIRVTGVYDAATRGAAKEVQRRNKLNGWGQVNRATFEAAIKEQDMSKTLESVFNSRVAGSPWKGPLWEHIVNGNAHAYDAKVASEQALKEVRELRKEIQALKEGK